MKSLDASGGSGGLPVEHRFKPVFVAIGALHLGRRKGVLQLLRQRVVVEAG